MEPNSLQLEFDVVKGLKVDENWISSDRRKGNVEERIRLKKICLQSMINGSQMKETGGNARDQI